MDPAVKMTHEMEEGHQVVSMGDIFPGGVDIQNPWLVLGSSLGVIASIEQFWKKGLRIDLMAEAKGAGEPSVDGESDSLLEEKTVTGRRWELLAREVEAAVFALESEIQTCPGKADGLL